MPPAPASRRDTEARKQARDGSNRAHGCVWQMTKLLSSRRINFTTNHVKFGILHYSSTILLRLHELRSCDRMRSSPSSERYFSSYRCSLSRCERENEQQNNGEVPCCRIS